MKLARLAVAALAVACQKAMPPAQQSNATPGPAPGTPEWKIQNAMSAAPAAIVAGATIMDWPATPGGQMTQLRAGTNGWTCLPDMPSTAMNDPICADQTTMEWFGSFMGKKTPAIRQVGFSYMLQGGEASNTDPSAEKPDSTNHWVRVGPHAMVVVPSVTTLAGYSADPGSGGPWVMWKGTPYAHVMVPTKP